MKPSSEPVDFHPTSIGVALDRDAGAWGRLRDSTSSLNDIGAIRERLAYDGYVLLRQVLDEDSVLNARKRVLADMRPAQASPRGTRATVQSANQRYPAVRALANGEAMVDLFNRYFSETPRVYDHIWLRTARRGQGTGPHCDIVYMGRGTHDLYTAWIPLGDVPLSHGPIIVLEGSHRAKIPRSYLSMDIDAGRNWSRIRYRHGKFFRGGDFSRDPRAVQRQFGLRWLSTDFRAGDILVFGAKMMHGALDNQSDSVRISIDARYQRLSEPADSRWIGPHPVGHENSRPGRP